MIENRLSRSLFCLLRLHQHLDLALKSPKIRGKERFFQSNIINCWLKSISICKNSWEYWLGERYITDTITNLLLHSISNSRHSVMGVIFNILIGRFSLKQQHTSPFFEPLEWSDWTIL